MQPKPRGPALPLRKGGVGQTARYHAIQKRRKQVSTVLTIVTGVMVFLALAIGVVSIVQSVTDRAVAPDLVGLTVIEAQAMVKREGLNWQQTEVFHNQAPTGTVVAQTPEADAEMSKGDSVVVTISLGPTQLTTPDLTDMTRAEASARLKELGLGMVVFKSPSTEAIDTVISQNPERNEPIALGQEIEVTVSGGSTLVPDLSGMAYEQALTSLKENSLAVGKVEYAEASSEDAIGTVLAQSPSAGTMAVLDAQMTLTIGIKGKAYHAELTVTVPSGTQSVPLRVTLVENGVEVEQYSGMTNAGSAYALIIPISSSLSGPLPCRAYLNGELIADQAVTLQ
jgi:serine/threonine-protein kinase